MTISETTFSSNSSSCSFTSSGGRLHNASTKLVLAWDLQISTWTSTRLYRWWAPSDGELWSVVNVSVVSSSLTVHHTRLSAVSDRTFPVAAARTWNSLYLSTSPRHPVWQFSKHVWRPTSSRCPSCTISVSCFYVTFAIVGFLLFSLFVVFCSLFYLNLYNQAVTKWSE